MSSFLLPKLVCKNIDSSLRKFWWGYKKDNSRNLSLHSWNKICTPKAQGGMSLKPVEVEEMNLALLSKIGWMMTSHSQRPWVKCLQVEYFRNSEFMQVERTSSSSWI